MRLDTQSRFVNAVKFAAEVHAGQVRKGTSVPYLSHLLQVAGLVWEFDGTEDEAIGGLLHDSAEDGGGEGILIRIREEFGQEVETIVRQNSDSVTESKEFKAPWRQRKEAYLAAIAHKSSSALLVSICDKLHNARNLVQDCRVLGPSHWDRFNASRVDSLWYYSSLVVAFERLTNSDLRLARSVEELRLVVESLYRLQS